VENSSRIQVEGVVGVDLGDRSSQICRLDWESGAIVEEKKLSTTKSSFQGYFEGGARYRVILESGTHSAWVRRLLEQLGHEVIVANPSKVRLISASRSKTDERDARCLAQLGRVDPELLSPVQPRSEEVQRVLAVVRARDGLVRARTMLINQVRGTVKSFGARMPACSAASFARRGMEALPQRFAHSRTVGAYVGLAPASRRSGNCVPQLPISKQGDQMLRRLLVQAAHYILGPFGPDSDLRRFGLRLAQRGGKNGKKKAVVAVARKLAVLLHRLWITGADYEPLRQAQKLAA
jgi:transposase